MFHLIISDVIQLENVSPEDGSVITCLTVKTFRTKKTVLLESALSQSLNVTMVVA